MATRRPSIRGLPRRRPGPCPRLTPPGSRTLRVVNYVLDGLRTEFPSAFGALARVRVARLKRESPFWAFLSANGAALVVSGILHLALLAAPRSVTDPVIRWPFGATLASMITFVASMVAGAVLVRAGGMRAIPLYIGFALLQALVSLPSFLLFCGRAGGDGACNAVIYIAAGRAPEWLRAPGGGLPGPSLCPAIGGGANLPPLRPGALAVTPF